MATTIYLMTTLLSVVEDLWIFAWDFVLEVINFVTPNRKKGHVTPQGTPGAGGKWPQYVPSREGDSRSACPALNALANHGESIIGYYLNFIVYDKFLFLARHPPTRW
jgi:hypothetical protein